MALTKHGHSPEENMGTDVDTPLRKTKQDT